jgi:alpha/beta superfamily hydrolase
MSSQDSLVRYAITAFTQNDTSELAKLFEQSLITPKFNKQLARASKSLRLQYGNFIKIGEKQNITQESGGYTKTVRNVCFEHDSIGVALTFNSVGYLIGLFITSPIIVYKDAEYVFNEKFNTDSVIISNDSIIHGVVTMPKNISKCSFVILVHGSGPSDMDETIGPNKPFRDIAGGLSSYGVAVLRYDKRTLVDKMINADTLTLQGEVVNDVLQAVKFLRQNYSDKIVYIYIAGHSLGGYSLPLIASQCSDVSGFIALSAPARPIQELIKYQLEYLIQHNSDSYSKSDIEDLQTEIAKCNNVTNGNFNASTPQDSLPLKMNATYLMFFKDYEPISMFKKDGRPILFIQGERDYQVTDVDFSEWKKGLSGQKNCTFKLLAGLNHLYQFGTTISLPNEYNQKQNVSQKVIDCIIKWLKKE